MLQCHKTLQRLQSQCSNGQQPGCRRNSFYLPYPFSTRHLEKKTDATHAEAVKQKYTPKRMKACETLGVLILPCKKLEEEKTSPAVYQSPSPEVRSVWGKSLPPAVSWWLQSKERGHPAHSTMKLQWQLSPCCSMRHYQPPFLIQQQIRQKHLNQQPGQALTLSSAGEASAPFFSNHRCED